MAGAHVGLLLAVISLTFLAAAYRKDYQPPLAVLALGSAAGIDLYYALNDRIWDTYLVDAAGEILLIQGWMNYFFKGN